MKTLIITRRQILIFAASFTVILMSVITVLGNSGVRGAFNPNKKVPIYQVQRPEEEAEKLISISFDAAWGDEQTDALLEAMAKYNVRSTFFLVGQWVDHYPESVAKIYEYGHEVMNHSATHPYMSKLSKPDMLNEIRVCNDKIEAITGVRPSLFRPPYGDYSDALIEVLGDEKMYCIQWDIDTFDIKMRFS